MDLYKLFRPDLRQRWNLLLLLVWRVVDILWPCSALWRLICRPARGLNWGLGVSGCQNLFKMFRWRPSWSRILHRFKIRSKTVLDPGISAQSHCVRETCLISFSDSATISHPRIRPWRFWRSHRLARTFWFRVHEQTGARHVIAISAAATNTQRSTRGGRRHRTANYLWWPQETPENCWRSDWGKLCPERRWNWRKLEIDPFPLCEKLGRDWDWDKRVTRWQRNDHVTQCRCSKRLLIHMFIDV